ncbi:MAG: hypothetical protein IKN70_07670 [Fibrobacter sp.]|nr:hypothetical protein [Fibrobacter sp.]
MPFLKKRPWIAMALVVACICMWGCGLLDDEERFVVDKNRTNGYLVAIIDDSLAVMENLRGWELWDDDCNSWEYCDKGTMNPGLFLVNYRKKQSPLWGDTVEGRISIVYGYYHDSSAMFSNADGEFGFWRIGEKPRVVREWKWEDTCKWEGYGLRASAWIDGKILMKGAFHCGFAILDTTTGNVSNLEYTGDYAWLEGCDDITYIDEEIICLKRLAGAMGAVSLLTSKGVIDSLENTKERDFLGYPPILYGNFMLVQVYRKDLLGIRIMLKVNKNGFGFSYPEMWMSSNVFVDSSGISVGYSFEDLVVTR